MKNLEILALMFTVLVQGGLALAEDSASPTSESRAASIKHPTWIVVSGGESSVGTPGSWNQMKKKPSTSGKCPGKSPGKDQAGKVCGLKVPDYGVTCSDFAASFLPCYEGGFTVRTGDIIHLTDGDKPMDVKLRGVDAFIHDFPNPKEAKTQTCQDAEGKDYDCGTRSKQHLKWLLRHVDTIRCAASGGTRFGEVVYQTVTCKVEGGIINAEMVEDGWAVNDDTNPQYREEEARAERNKAGAHAGSFQRPYTIYRDLGLR